jgi:hypothetical protein
MPMSTSSALKSACNRFPAVAASSLLSAPLMLMKSDALA